MRKKILKGIVMMCILFTICGITCYAQTTVSFESKSNQNITCETNGQKLQGWNEVIKYYQQHPESKNEFMQEIGKLVNLQGLKDDYANLNVKTEFTDVSQNDWCFDAIAKCEKLGLIFGYGDGRFGPNDNVTREQTYFIIYRFPKIWFPDSWKTWEELNGTIMHTPGEETARQLYLWNILIDPDGDQEFGYNKFMDDEMQKGFSPREEAASLVTRYSVPSEGYNTILTEKIAPHLELNNGIKFLVGEDSFEFYEENPNRTIPDLNEIDSTLRADIEIGYAKGNLNGYDSSGMFKPKNSVTRAEFCQMISDSGLIDKALIKKNRLDL